MLEDNFNRGTAWGQIFSEIQETVGDYKINTVLCQYKDATHETIDLIIKSGGTANNNLLAVAEKPEVEFDTPKLPQQKPVFSLGTTESIKQESSQVRPDLLSIASPAKDEERKQASEYNSNSVKGRSSNEKNYEGYASRIIRRVAGNIGEDRSGAISRPKPKILRKSFI